MRISFDSAVTANFDIYEVLTFSRVSAVQQDINEFVAIDDKTSNSFHEEILEEANFFF